MKNKRICKHCGKETDSRNTYCSNRCQQDHQYEEYIKRWMAGLETGIRGTSQISMYVRRYLFEKYDGKCAQCGWDKKNPATGLCPLEIDHIDGNYLHNTEDNLVLLCPNCHSLTPTYKALNKGNGRGDNRPGRNKKGDMLV